MNGYLKLQRKFYSHWLWEEKRIFSKAEAWLDLLQLAAYAPTKRIIRGQLIRLDEGECIASVRYLAVRWQWGKDKVAKFMLLLESDNMIRRMSRQGETIISLCNYRDYVTPPDTDTDSHQTVSRQSPDSEQTKDKKDKKDKNLLSAENIYQAYPRKVAKPKALAAIQKALKTKKYDQLLKLTNDYAEARKGEDPTFTPHPASWFNAARYDDDPETWRSTTRLNGAINPEINKKGTSQYA